MERVCFRGESFAKSLCGVWNGTIPWSFYKWIFFLSRGGRFSQQNRTIINYNCRTNFSIDDFYLKKKKKSFDKVPLQSHFISLERNVSSPLYLYLINRTPDIISRSVKQRQRQTGSPLPHSRTRWTNSTCTNQSRRLLFLPSPSSMARFFPFLFPLQTSSRKRKPSN